jgi:hypothetical protein
MSNNKAKKQSYEAVLASVKEEMAEPRAAKSAQIDAKKHGAATVKKGAHS